MEGKGPIIGQACMEDEKGMGDEKDPEFGECIRDTITCNETSAREGRSQKKISTCTENSSMRKQA